MWRRFLAATGHDKPNLQRSGSDICIIRASSDAITACSRSCAHPQTDRFSRDYFISSVNRIFWLEERLIGNWQLTAASTDFETAHNTHSRTPYAVHARNTHIRIQMPLFPNSTIILEIGLHSCRGLRAPSFTNKTRYRTSTVIDSYWLIWGVLSTFLSHVQNFIQYSFFTRYT